MSSARQDSHAVAVVAPSADDRAAVANALRAAGAHVVEFERASELHPHAMRDVQLLLCGGQRAAVDAFVQELHDLQRVHDDLRPPAVLYFGDALAHDVPSAASMPAASARAHGETAAHADDATTVPPQSTAPDAPLHGDAAAIRELRDAVSLLHEDLRALRTEFRSQPKPLDPWHDKPRGAEEDDEAPTSSPDALRVQHHHDLHPELGPYAGLTDETPIMDNARSNRSMLVVALVIFVAAVVYLVVVPAPPPTEEELQEMAAEQAQHAERGALRAAEHVVLRARAMHVREPLLVASSTKGCSELVAAENYVMAVLPCSRAFTRDPSAAADYATALIETGAFENALAVARMRLAATPDDLATWFSYARAARGLEDAASERFALNELVRLAPESLHGLAARARLDAIDTP